jgi:hypothetical protein
MEVFNNQPQWLAVNEQIIIIIYQTSIQKMKIKYNTDVENLQLSHLGVVSLLSKQKESKKEVNKKKISYSE